MDKAYPQLNGLLPVQYATMIDRVYVFYTEQQNISKANQEGCRWIYNGQRPFQDGTRQ